MMDSSDDRIQEHPELHSVLLLELKVLLPQGVDGVNHNLNQLHLGIAETVLVGDVISVA